MSDSEKHRENHFKETQSHFKKAKADVYVRVCVCACTHMSVSRITLRVCEESIRREGGRREDQRNV